MPFEKGTYWKIVCDECGETDGFTAEGQGYTVAESEQEARQVVTDCEGAIEDARIVCCACLEERAMAKERKS